MRRYSLLLWSLACLFFPGCGQVANPKPADSRPEYFARYVESHAKPQPVGSLAPLLHIEEMVGQVELNSGFQGARLALQVYQDGKRVELSDFETPLPVEAATSCTLTYAVRMVDLDYLPLGGGKKGHCRLRVDFAFPEGATAFVEKDLPKSLIDLSKSSGLSFSEQASHDAEVPLLWWIMGKEIPLNVKTQPEVLAKAREGKVLFLTLHFDHGSPKKVKRKR